MKNNYSDFTDFNERERVKSIFYVIDLNLNRIKSLINKESVGFACYNFYVCIGEYTYCLEIHKKYYVENRNLFEEMVSIYNQLYIENKAIMKKDISEVFSDRVNRYKETTMAIISDGGKSLLEDMDDFESILLLKRDHLAYALNAVKYLGHDEDFMWIGGLEKSIAKIDHEVDPIRKKYLSKYVGTLTQSFYNQNIHPPTFFWRK